MGIALIVVTGLPFKGKETPATLIARWLHCPSSSVADILEGLIRPEEEDNRNIINHHGLLSAAFNVLSHQASRLIYTVDSEKGRILLEFPFCPSRLEKLIEEMATIERVLIIECTARDKNIWRNELAPDTKFLQAWYHAASAADRLNGANIEKAMEQEHELIVSSDFGSLKVGSSGVNRVSKLEMDVDFDYTAASLLPIGYFDSSVSSIPLFDAIDHLLARDLDTDGPLSITMRQWGEIKYDLVSQFSQSRVKSALCFKGKVDHDIFYAPQSFQADNQSGNTSTCWVCEKPVGTGPTYSCLSCPIDVHKACAELFSNDAPSGSQHFPELFFYTTKLLGVQTSLGDNRTMRPCETCGATASWHLEFPTCKSCILGTVLRRHLRPMIILHPLFLPGFLQIQYFSPVRFNVCAACGRPIRNGIAYFYKLHSLYYGFSCVTTQRTPVEKEYQHFGHQHPLKLKLKPYEEFDYYVCHVCGKERSPQNWYYHCEECDYTAHIYCVCSHPDGYH